MHPEKKQKTSIIFPCLIRNRENTDQKQVVKPYK